MYMYNYMHIWRAARNVKTTPANNYGVHGSLRRAGTAVRSGSDSDVIFYLNRTKVPVIGTVS